MFSDINVSQVGVAKYARCGRIFITISLQIYQGIFLCINFENRLKFDRITAVSLWPHFMAHPVDVKKRVYVFSLAMFLTFLFFNVFIMKIVSSVFMIICTVCYFATLFTIDGQCHVGNHNRKSTDRVAVCIKLGLRFHHVLKRTFFIFVHDFDVSFTLFSNDCSTSMLLGS